MIPYSNTLSGLLEPCGENILSFRVRVTRIPANQRPVFESRDMAWPIRGQIHSCHPPPLWPPVHIWLPPDKTSLRPDIISTRSSMSVTIKYFYYCWVSHPDAVQNLTILAKVSQWSAVTHRVEKNLKRNKGFKYLVPVKIIIIVLNIW